VLVDRAPLPPHAMQGNMGRRRMHVTSWDVGRAGAGGGSREQRRGRHTKIRAVVYLVQKWHKNSESWTHRTRN
jgi:hypothetical protein